MGLNRAMKNSGGEPSDAKEWWCHFFQPITALGLVVRRWRFWDKIPTPHPG
jgi:hypothetical protein